MSKVRVALVQNSPVLYGKEENVRKIEKASGKARADLYVFGEMFLTGYACRDEFPRLAEPLDGRNVRAVSRIAEKRGATIVFGMPELEERTKHVYNSCVVATPDGEVNSYRKVYLANFGAFEEKQYFKPGDALEPIDTPAGRLGCLVCYDIFFPEVSKTYAMKGADMLVCISASPTSTGEFFEKVMLARAIESTVFFLYANLVGPEKGMVFWGGNAVVGPRGDLKAKGAYLKEDIVQATVDLEENGVARRLRPTLRNTRHEMLDLLEDAGEDSGPERD